MQSCRSYLVTVAPARHQVQPHVWTQGRILADTEHSVNLFRSQRRRSIQQALMDHTLRQVGCRRVASGLRWRGKDGVLAIYVSGAADLCGFVNEKFGPVREGSMSLKRNLHWHTLARLLENSYSARQQVVYSRLEGDKNEATELCIPGTAVDVDSAVVLRPVPGPNNHVRKVVFRKRRQSRQPVGFQRPIQGVC